MAPAPKFFKNQVFPPRLSKHPNSLPTLAASHYFTFQTPKLIVSKYQTILRIWIRVSLGASVSRYAASGSQMGGDGALEKAFART